MTVTETDTSKRRPSREAIPYLIFLSFILGLLFSCKTEMRIPTEAYIQDFPVLSLYLVFVILISSSVFGPLLFPVSAFLFGIFTYSTAENIMEVFLSGGEIDFKLTLIALAIFPLFFVLSEKGTVASGLIIKALSGQSMAAKDKYNRNSFPLYAGVTLLLLAAFILKEIKA